MQYFSNFCGQNFFASFLRIRSLFRLIMEYLLTHFQYHLSILWVILLTVKNIYFHHLLFYFSLYHFPQFMNINEIVQHLNTWNELHLKWFGSSKKRTEIVDQKHYFVELEQKTKNLLVFLHFCLCWLYFYIILFSSQINCWINKWWW